jgi:hypothetical protein
MISQAGMVNCFLPWLVWLPDPVEPAFGVADLDLPLSLAAAIEGIGGGGGAFWHGAGGGGGGADDDFAVEEAVELALWCGFGLVFPGNSGTSLES